MNIKLATAKLTTAKLTLAKLTLAVALAVFAGGCASSAPQPSAPAAPRSYQRFDTSELRDLELPPKSLDFQMDTRRQASQDVESPGTAYPVQKASVGHKLRLGFAPLPSVE